MQSLAEDKKIDSILSVCQLHSSKALYKTKKAPLFKRGFKQTMSAKDEKLMKAVG